MSGCSASWYSNGGGGCYRAVGDRCAVDLGRLRIAGTVAEQRTAIESVGCTVLSVDLIALARSRVGCSVWRRGARTYEAPGVVDCSSFTKWIFGQAGIWIPRRSIQQRDWVGNGGVAVTCRDDVQPRDLVFVSGWRDYWDVDPAHGIGHVGIVTDTRTVVHAANASVGVIESSLDEFLDIARFRGARRMIPDGGAVLTVQTPDREVDTEDDIRWMILQRLR